MRDIRFENLRTSELTEEDFGECSALYSNNYGRYSAEAPKRAGDRIRMSPAQYQKRYVKEGCYVARAFEEERLVGHAFYIRKKYEPYGTVSWVLQLVVDERYRRLGIASSLLRSIWGLSDDYAWGLASANPCTVRTLESATFRRCRLSVIKKNEDLLREVGRDTSFLSDDSFVIGDGISQVDSAFFADNSSYEDDENIAKRLGKLKPGHEWLAFVFREQQINKKSYQRHFVRMLDTYEPILKNAYGRMEMNKHPWARGTENELQFITGCCDGGKVLDIGCGSGRHAVGLAKLGFDVLGVDFSERNIEIADEHALEAGKYNGKLEFICTDARGIMYKEEFDLVLCLYDVIGSFPNDSDNKKILRAAARALKKGGLLILSVMNLELTKSLIPSAQIGDIKNEPHILYELAPSSTMQDSGQIFNGKYLAMDKKSGIIYRKEQFVAGSELPAEYVIRDRRFCKDEMEDMIEAAGLRVVDSRHVQAGHFDVPLKALDNKAKEILFVCRRLSDDNK